jgi:hypothetical protein
VRVSRKHEALCKYAAEQHAKRYGYEVATFTEIDASALEYNRKPVWNADRYPEPEQPETETAEAAQNEEEKTMKNAEFIAQVCAILNGRKCRSAWDRGVMQYAEELTAELDEHMRSGYITQEQLATADGRKTALLNGAKDWNQYSYGGGALIYDYEIAERLCNQSELKKTRGGERNPNSRETWLDCQARALGQAAARVREAVRFVLWRAGKEVH